MLSVFDTRKCHIFVNKFGFTEFNDCILVYTLVIKLEDLPPFNVYVLVYTFLIKSVYLPPFSVLCSCVHISD